MSAPDPAPPSSWDGPLRYTTIAAPVQAQIEVKRSRFLADLAPAPDEDAARAVVEAARRAHHDARHHCSAFVLGPQRRTQRSNDDGEPAGTAGAPMLEVLRGSGHTDVVAVVTRWFGGTLLGTGGLIRAYSDAVAQALEAARPLARELRRGAHVDVDIADAGRLEHELRGADTALLRVAGIDYGPFAGSFAGSFAGDRVVARVGLWIDPGRAEEAEAVVAALTGGADRLVIGADLAWSDA